MCSNSGVSMKKPVRSHTRSLRDVPTCRELVDMKRRVAACQILTFPDVRASADKIIKWMKQAAREGVEVVAFPEAALCGYPGDPNYWKRAKPEDFRRQERRMVGQTFLSGSQRQAGMPAPPAAARDRRRPGVLLLQQ